MSIDILMQTLINGVFLGGIYALVAVGLTLIYGVMVIINFAHGEFLMIGMYISFWIFTLLGIDPYLSLVVVAFLLFLLGVLFQRVLIQPALKATTMNQIMLTLGLSTFLVGAAQFFWQAQPRNAILPYAHQGLHIGNLVLNYPKMLAFVISVVITLSLYAFLKYSRTGKAIRACSQSRDAARLMGIDVNKIYLLTMGIGTSLTGIAGALLIPSYPVNPTIGSGFGFTAFIIVVLGSMGNFIGAFIGSIIIGLAEAFGGLFVGSDVRQVFSMGIFILVLLLRPEGLFGRKS